MLTVQEQCQRQGGITAGPLSWSLHDDKRIVWSSHHHTWGMGYSWDHHTHLVRSLSEPETGCQQFQRNTYLKKANTRDIKRSARGLPANTEKGTAHLNLAHVHQGEPFLCACNTQERNYV